MASLNQCSFIGNVGKDPEVKYSQAGTAVANFSIACNETWKDKNGEKQERTEWVRCVAWDKLAEIIAQYVSSGKQLFVQGRMQTRKWEDKEGVERYTTEIVVDKMKMLGSKPEGESQERTSSKPANATTAKRAPTVDDLDDDVPF